MVDKLASNCAITYCLTVGILKENWSERQSQDPNVGWDCLKLASYLLCHTRIPSTQVVKHRLWVTLAERRFWARSTEPVLQLL